MFGLVALVLMIVLTVLYLGELGLKMVLLFWAAYIATWFLPLIGIPSMVASLLGLVISGGYLVVAKSV